MAKTPKVNGNVNVSETSKSDDKKRQTSKSLYVNAAGETTRSPDAESVIVRFVFDGIPEPVDLKLSDLNEEIRHLGLCQGINIKLQRSYNTAKGNAAQMRQECEDTAQNLLDGVWTGEREGGLRIADLIEAIASTLRDAGDTNVDDARLASIREKLHDEAARDKAKGSPKVKAHLARIALEKATARANEAAGVDTSGDTTAQDF